MDTQELAAGVLCVGFNGITLESGAKEELKSFPAAGVILLSKNVVNLAQVRSLTDEIRDLYGAGPDPIIAIDQEGGRVSRIHDGVAELPPMLALGATGDSDLARRAGREVGSDLRRAGVNFMCGPVLDLAVFRENTVIGARSFGEDPQTVSTIAGAFSGGLSDAGIVAAYKHFPGHGSTVVDSNVQLPIVDASAATLRSRDLVPFAQLLPGAQAVMTAHIVAKAFDEHRPATISPLILNRLLRRELGFGGVCFTDCMQMDAITKSFGAPVAAINALLAGADCVLVSKSLAMARAIALAIAAAVDSGRLPRERLEDAYERVSALREGLSSPLPIDAERDDASVGGEIAQRAITCVRGGPQADPQQSIIVSFEGTMLARGTAGLISQYFSLATDYGVPEIKVPLEPPLTIVQNVIDKILSSGRRPIVLMRRAHIFGKQALAIERILQARPDALIVSMLEPYDAFMFPEARTVLCAYGDERCCIEGLAQVLFNGAEATGTLPVTNAA